MRKLVYDCYFEDTLIKTVTSYAAAVEWASKDRHNSYKDRLIKMNDKKELTKEETDKQKEQIKKRIEKIRSKKAIK